MFLILKNFVEGIEHTWNVCMHMKNMLPYNNN